jgi:hypothetical protein
MINSNVMSKYLGIIIGAIAVILGLTGLAAYRGDLLVVLRGSIPAIFILGGAIAVIAGLSEIADEISSKKNSK